ncbi:MAG: type II secretion system F family protein [Dongiaceae bacterium]
MARFRYKAVSPAGVILEGEVEASARAAVIERLRRDGNTPIRADELKDGAGRSLTRGLFARRRLGEKDVVLLTRELSTLLHAGLALDRALGILGEIAEPGPQRDFINRVLDSVRGGASLAEALETFKDSLAGFYVGMVRAGEAGGSLETVLSRLADTLERTAALKESVRSAMYYPILVLFMSMASLLILMVWVVPQFAPLFNNSGAPIPLPMHIILSIGDFIAGYWWAMVAAAALAALLLRRHVREPAGRLRWDRWKLGLPLLGELIVKVEVARFTRTLGTLLANGVTVLNAMSIALGTLGNRALAQATDGLTARLKRGEGLAMPMMDCGAFPRLAVQLIQVGEESGQLDGMLIRVADIYDDEVKRALDRLMSLLVPVITIGLGVLVAAIIASMVTAILSVYDLSI